MRIIFLACFLMASLFACAPSHEDEAQREVRDRLSSSEGGRLLLRSIEAHGGLEAWFEAPTSAYAWEFSSPNMLMKSYLLADNRTRQVYHDLLSFGTREDPRPMEARFAWDGSDAWISPDTLLEPNPRFWATTAYYFQSIPFVLADPGVNYAMLPDEEIDGTPHHMLKASFDDGVGDSPGDTYTLYINQETGLVDAIRYSVTFGRRRPSPGEDVRESLLYYLDYVMVDGLRTPSRFVGYAFDNGQKGEERTRAHVTDISFRTPFDASRLEMPADGRIEPMPSMGE